MNKNLIIGTVLVVVVGIFALVGLFFWQQSRTEWPPEDVVELPGTGSFAYVNRLTILASGQDIEAIVKGFDGEVTLSIQETDTYEVRFPVSSLIELDQIKNVLNGRGIHTVYSYIMPPIDCGRGPC